MKCLIFLPYLFYTAMLSAQWTVQNSGVTTTLNDIFFIDTQTGWAVGDSAVVLKTSDGGRHWNALPPGNNIFNIYEIKALDCNNSYIICNSTSSINGQRHHPHLLFHTRDGGVSWSKISIPHTEYTQITSWQIADEESLWIGIMEQSGSPAEGLLYCSSVGGLNWRLSHIREFEHPVSIHALQNGMCWSIWERIVHVSTPSYFLVSDNGGDSWVEQSEIGRDIRKSLVSRDNNTLLASSSTSIHWMDSVLKRWYRSEIPQENGFRYYVREGVQVSTSNFLYLGRKINNDFTGSSYTVMFESDDKGISWRIEHLFPYADIELRSMTVAYPPGKTTHLQTYEAWVCGNNGFILHKTKAYARDYTMSDGYLLLEQNYPNPFKAEKGTCIPVILNADQSVTFTLFDILGRPVNTSLHIDLQQGEHWINLPPSFFSESSRRLPSGVYFLSVRTQYEVSHLKLILSQ